MGGNSVGKDKPCSVLAAQQVAAADPAIESRFEGVFAFERFELSLAPLRQPQGGLALVVPIGTISMPLCEPAVKTGWG